MICYVTYICTVRINYNERLKVRMYVVTYTNIILYRTYLYTW